MSVYASQDALDPNAFGYYGLPANGSFLDVPETMHATNVRWLYRKTLGSGNPSTPPPPFHGDSTTSAKSPLPSYPPPKAKKIWKISTRKQQDYASKKGKDNHDKLAAHKYASIIYVEKKPKPHGKSGRVLGKSKSPSNNNEKKLEIQCMPQGSLWRI